MRVVMIDKDTSCMHEKLYRAIQEARQSRSNSNKEIDYIELTQEELDKLAEEIPGLKKPKGDYKKYGHDYDDVEEALKFALKAVQIKKAESGTKHSVGTFCGYELYVLK